MNQKFLVEILVFLEVGTSSLRLSKRDENNSIGNHKINNRFTGDMLSQTKIKKKSIAENSSFLSEHS